MASNRCNFKNSISTHEIAFEGMHRTLFGSSMFLFKIWRKCFRNGKCYWWLFSYHHHNCRWTDSLGLRTFCIVTMWNLVEFCLILASEVFLRILVWVVFFLIVITLIRRMLQIFVIWLFFILILSSWCLILIEGVFWHLYLVCFLVVIGVIVVNPLVFFISTYLVKLLIVSFIVIKLIIVIVKLIIVLLILFVLLFIPSILLLNRLFIFWLLLRPEFWGWSRHLILSLRILSLLFVVVRLIRNFPKRFLLGLVLLSLPIFWFRLIFLSCFMTILLWIVLIWIIFFIIVWVLIVILVLVLILLTWPLLITFLVAFLGILWLCIVLILRPTPSPPTRSSASRASLAFFVVLTLWWVCVLISFLHL